MEKFEWVSFPIRDESVVKNLIAFLGFLLMILVGFVYLGVVGIFISLIAVLITFLPYVLPTKYTIDDKSITVKFFFTSKTYDFKNFKSYYIDDKGILLSPFEKPNRLENFRGVYIRFGKYRDEVEKMIVSKYSK
ncbi:MAG: hypothetical protein ABIN05_07020 [candidate division WOR-3 bacterium]